MNPIATYQLSELAQTHQIFTKGGPEYFAKFGSHEKCQVSMRWQKCANVRTHNQPFLQAFGL